MFIKEPTEDNPFAVENGLACILFQFWKSQSRNLGIGQNYIAKTFLIERNSTHIQIPIYPILSNETVWFQ